MTATGTRGGFPSAPELRAILDRVLREIDSDPVEGPRLRSAAAPIRFEFEDLKLTLNLSRCDRAAHWLQWDFSRRSGAHPGLELNMDSDFANRLLQGRENPVIAIARGNLRTSVGDARDALRFFPAAESMFARYRRIVASEYPHLALD